MAAVPLASANYQAYNLSDWLAFSSADNQLQGYPPTAGLYQFDVTCQGVTTTYLIDSQPPSPQITSPAQATGSAGQPFSYQITASQTADPYDVAGLPDGLQVNAGGLISGTPAYGGTNTVPNSNQALLPYGAQVDPDSFYLYRQRKNGTGTPGTDYTVEGITYLVEAAASLDGPWHQGQGSVEFVGRFDNGDGTKSVLMRVTQTGALRFVRLRLRVNGP